MRFCDRIMFGLCSECRRIVFLLAEAIHGVSAEILNLQISWQAQYVEESEYKSQLRLNLVLILHL